MRIRHRAVAGAILRRPLIRTRRTLGQLPIVFEKVFEEVVAPLGRRRGPCDFETAADGVSPKTFTEFILPPEALVFDCGAFRFGAYVVRWNSSAVSLPEGMAGCNQCDCFLVVHGHALEGFANVPARRNGIGLSIRPFRVYVNQTHLHGSKWVREITIATVALVCQPRAFRSPVQFFGFPNIGASATEAEGFKSHILESYVSCEDHQVRPGNLSSIFLLDRPEQTARLVEVHIVGPAVQR